MSYWLTTTDSSLAEPAPFDDLRADRDVVVDRARRDDDAGRMHARVARQAFERHRIVEQLLVALVVAIELADVGDLFDGLFDRQREVRLIRDQLGQRVRLRRREPERAADVLDGRARLHRPERHDLADRLLAVLLPDVLDHLAAALEAEVDVDVGHRHALGIQKTLEEQIVLERTHVGDLQRVGHERSRRRPAARTDRNAAIARRLDEIGDDQEVAGVARLRDHRSSYSRRSRTSAGSGSPYRSFAPAVASVVSNSFSDATPGGQRKRRHVILLRELDVHLVGDLERVLEHVGPTREVRRDLRRGLEVQTAIVVHAIRIAAILAESDAEENVVRVVVSALLRKCASFVAMTGRPSSDASENTRSLSVVCPSELCACTSR